MVCIVRTKKGEEGDHLSRGRSRSAAVNSAKTNRGECPAPAVQPSSPPWRAIRSSCARRLRSPRPRVLAVGGGTGSSPAAACRSPSSLMPSRRSWLRRDNCAVLARVRVPRRCPSHPRRTRAERLESPFLSRLAVGCRGSRRRMVGMLVLVVVRR